MDLARRFIVRPGTKVDLGKRDPRDSADIKSKKDGTAALAKNLERLKELQYLLYAEGKRSVLILLQAMDAGGKDGTIRHVLGPLNPQGVRVTSFKAPNDVELAHDFLWRIHHNVPRAGDIGVFNRSHYEDVLIVRVHDLVPRRVWSKRYRQINDFERLLAESGVTVLKFFLHISKDEQLKRFRARLREPHKRWKFNPADSEERKHWDAYQAAYEDVLERCSRPGAPWYVIPADRKWFRNLAVSQILLDAMEKIKLKVPAPKFKAADFHLD